MWCASGRRPASQSSPNFWRSAASRQQEPPCRNSAERPRGQSGCKRKARRFLPSPTRPQKLLAAPASARHLLALFFQKDPIVQRLGHRPFTADTRVRIPLGSLSFRGGWSLRGSLPPGAILQPAGRRDSRTRSASGRGRENLAFLHGFPPDGQTIAESHPVQVFQVQDRRCGIDHWIADFIFQARRHVGHSEWGER